MVFRFKIYLLLCSVFIFWMSLFFLGIAADDRNLYRLRSKEYQNTLMMGFFSLSHRDLDAETFSACGERHVLCNANDLVEAICVDQEKSLPKNLKTIDIAWAPPSIKFMHLGSVFFVKNVSSRDLPRELRYLYFAGCRKWEMGHLQYAFDLQNLPTNLEEMILSGGILRGQIALTHLPGSLRILMLNTCQKRVKSNVLVDYSILPETLRFAFVTSYFSEHSIRIRKFGDFAADERVRVGGTHSVYGDVSLRKFAKEQSEYFVKYDEIAALCFYTERADSMHEI